MSKWAFTFPGQGSQKVGMGKELAAAFPEARAVFDEVDDVLGHGLSAIMFEGPDEALRLTENAQPALMASSMAIVRVLEKAGVTIEKDSAFVAGHSLGEYSALCAAGALTLADTARLLRIRGRAMQQAVPVGAGAMAAILGLERGTVAKIAAEAAGQSEVCDLANDNAPGQIVISGHASAIARAGELAKQRGCRRTIVLPVSAPFHCSLMASAAGAMRAALSQVAMLPPVVPLIANVLARPVSDPDDIRIRLVEQVTAMVRWTESIGFLTGEGGVTHFVELGTGKVLTGVVRRIAPRAHGVAVASPAEIDAFVTTLNG